MAAGGAESLGRCHFGEFVLDPGTRELLRGGHPVHLSPKAFHLLELLAASAPNAVSKADLQERLWPDTFVIEANVSHLVRELRSALGDDPARPRYIRTVYGFGYAFQVRPVPMGPVERAPAELVCVLRWTAERVALSRGSYVIGRDPCADVVIESTTVSRRHARLSVGSGTVTLEDLGSRNGTFVVDQRVEGPTPLADRDEIMLGAVPIRVRLYTGDATTEAVRGPGSRAAVDADDGADQP
jgi:DNA-binding winged helix-turn-helix (wHTH) protein